jgi:hypothetical protein
VVRTRKPTAQERLNINFTDYPQKQAVLFALRELKGENTDVSQETPLAAAKAGALDEGFTEGDRVEVLSRRSHWRLAVVISREQNGKYQVQYDSLGGRVHEWVAKDYIRIKAWE